MAEYVPRIILKRDHKSLSLWKTIIEKIEIKLSTWSSCYTSKDGRLSLIQVATLSNLLHHYMSLFEIPQKNGYEYRKIRNFCGKIVHTLSDGIS